ncbi:hypothetical protein CEXT_630031 [Caerostris extrusa]|uniref:Uncharacterized protein n=1 Tax=Caerostris extrusa TaxID=172846 RepID=A0AAV4RUL1_CAEEX|nr:hypothetical protein CEXT_630031 [Caerostris extrusa]
MEWLPPTQGFPKNNDDKVTPFTYAIFAFPQRIHLSQMLLPFNGGYPFFLGKLQSKGYGGTLYENERWDIEKWVKKVESRRGKVGGREGREKMEGGCVLKVTYGHSWGRRCERTGRVQYHLSTDRRGGSTDGSPRQLNEDLDIDSSSPPGLAHYRASSCRVEMAAQDLPFPCSPNVAEIIV